MGFQGQGEHLQRTIRMKYQNTCTKQAVKTMTGAHRLTAAIHKYFEEALMSIKLL